MVLAGTLIKVKISLFMKNNAEGFAGEIGPIFIFGIKEIAKFVIDNAMSILNSRSLTLMLIYMLLFVRRNSILMNFRRFN
jgi:hypothetical protein